MATLGHQREARRRLVSPVAAYVRMRKVLPSYGFDVLDVDDISKDARLEHLFDCAVVGRVTHYCV